jgi:hypothetical protein
MPYSEDAVAPVTDPSPKKVGTQVIGVMVVLHLPETMDPEKIVNDIRSSIEFGKADCRLAYVIGPPRDTP